MGTKSILYIEDNQEIGQWLKDELEQRGYDVCWLLTGDNAEKEVHRHDIVILDIMLPGLDGFTVGQRLKKNYSNNPHSIIVSSNRHQRQAARTSVYR